MRKKIGTILLVGGIVWLVASWFIGGPGIAQWLLIIAGGFLICIKRRKSPKSPNDIEPLGGE